MEIQHGLERFCHIKVVSRSGGSSIAVWFVMEAPDLKWDALGVPGYTYFSPYCGHVRKENYLLNHGQKPFSAGDPSF